MIARKAKVSLFIELSPLLTKRNQLQNLSCNFGIVAPLSINVKQLSPRPDNQALAFALVGFVPGDSIDARRAWR
jgi:hypothetical protein